MKLKRNKLWLFIIFIGLSIVLKLMRGEVMNTYTLEDLLLLDMGYEYDEITYLDDSFKYEKSILNGDNLSFYNGGVLLDVMLIIPKILSRDSPQLTLIFLIFLNIYIVFQIYKLFGNQSHKLDLLVLPYLSYLTISPNKEIYTIFALCILSPMAIKNNFYKIKDNSYLKTFFNIFRVSIGVLTILSIFLGRTKIFLAMIFFYLILWILKIFFSNKIEIKNIFKKSNIKYLVILILGFFVTISVYSFSSIYFKIIYDFNAYSTQASTSNQDLLFKLLSLPFAITAPFPFIFSALFDLRKIFSLYNFGIFNYYILTFLSFYRIRLIYSEIIRKNFIWFFLNKKYISSIFLTSFLVVLQGNEVTRQVITLSFPLMHFLNNEKINYRSPINL